jgi:tight adherence protein C
LAFAWAALLSAPLMRSARHVAMVARLDATRAVGSGPVRRRRLPRSWARPTGRTAHRDGARAVLGGAMRVLTERRRSRRDDATLVRQLPVVLDLLQVAAGAGCTPFLAFESAVRWAPAPLANRLQPVTDACALGSSFSEALDDLVRATPRLRPLADALLASERLGVAVTTRLEQLAGEERAAFRRRAEAHARQIPVRLLFPLVFLVLPAFVLLTVAPGVAAGLRRL